MNGFEKDLDKLVKFNDNIEKVKKDLVNLQSKLGEECTGFVEKYTIQNKIRKIGSIESLLNRGVSPKQLIDLIQKSDNETGLLPILPALKRHILGGELVNEFINYNEDVLRGLELELKSLDSIENNESLNNLIVSMSNMDYLIGEEVENSLKLAGKPGSIKINNEKQFVYMVIFNIIKQGDE